MKKINPNHVWRKAQQEELKCWDGVSDKIRTTDYIDKKRMYWERILSKLQLSTNDFFVKKILEVGCGPSGLTILLPGEEVHGNFFILDPLLDHYRKLFPLYFAKCIEITIPFEDWVMKQENFFDYIFAINVIDHCADIDRFMKQFVKLAEVNPGVVIFIGVNTHNYSWSEWIWQTFQRFLEPHHPHQYSNKGYEKIFKNYFSIVDSVDVEDEVVWINNVTRDSLSWDKKLRKFLSFFKPANFFIMILELVGYPLHDFKGIGRSIFKHRIFILHGKTGHV